jgi:peroxiredoxin Q/BCP
MSSKPLALGDSAPPFEAAAVGGAHDGRTVSLSGLRGRTVVLYFYPKDDTPGCTAQACGLRDAWPAVAGQAEVFGVSIDSVNSHAKFIEKHALPFPLLSDPEKRMVNAYGVWVQKSMYGRKYMGTERTTFVIGPDGRIRAVFRKVKPGEHAALVLGAINAL